MIVKLAPQTYIAKPVNFEPALEAGKVLVEEDFEKLSESEIKKAVVMPLDRETKLGSSRAGFFFFPEVKIEVSEGINGCVLPEIWIKETWAYRESDEQGIVEKHKPALSNAIASILAKTEAVLIKAEIENAKAGFEKSRAKGDDFYRWFYEKIKENFRAFQQ